MIQTLRRGYFYKFRICVPRRVWNPDPIKDEGRANGTLNDTLFKAKYRNMGVTRSQNTTKWHNNGIINILFDGLTYNTHIYFANCLYFLPNSKFFVMYSESICFQFATSNIIISRNTRHSSTWCSKVGRNNLVLSWFLLAFASVWYIISLEDFYWFNDRKLICLLIGWSFSQSIVRSVYSFIHI